MLVRHAKGLLCLWINEAVKWPQYLRDYRQFAEETWNPTSCYSRCQLKIRVFLSWIYWSNTKPETFVTSAIHKKRVLNYRHDWALPQSGERIPILVCYLCCKTWFLPQMLPCFPHQKTSMLREAVCVHTSNHNKVKDSRERDEPRQ